MRTACFVGILGLLASSALAGDPITFESLLKEMVDREAIARFPDPAYTCKQFSSYDRASKTPDDPRTWFANGDYNQFLRTEQVPGPDGKQRKEWILADMDGPGAIVRIWSANPKGNLRIYIDNAEQAVIDAPMGDALGGKWKVAKPLSEECSRGWNLYLPIPYAKQCKITSDSDGFYYQVNYRTYAPGTTVVSADAGSMDRAAALITETNELLLATSETTRGSTVTMKPLRLGAGKSEDIHLPSGPYEVSLLHVLFDTPPSPETLRTVILSATFDGEDTVWAPLGDFFGSGVGLNPYKAWWLGVHKSGGMSCWFPMPYEHSGVLHLTNLGATEVSLKVETAMAESHWGPGSMHFHAAWHSEFPIHAYGGKGTKDWNYLQATGRGVYVGDSLAVMNPVPEWWGEGDEKIYVDGEAFPSHFGTGTEDYYGYAWSSNVPFQHPFHAQSRSDGLKHGNNWGHSTVSRVRALDAIPFTKSFKFDMEIWHWRECDEAYAATTYFYAMPGATTNRKPQPEEASAPIPQPPPLPPPFSIAGALECEDMKVLAQTPAIPVERQEMRDFGRGKWSGEAHLWVKGTDKGAFVELEIPVGPGPEGKKPVKVTLYATKSWDFGILHFTVNGAAAGPDIDMFSGEPGKAIPSGPIELGTFQPVDGRLVLRAEVVGANPKSSPPKSFFGLDCIVLSPAAAP